MGRITLARSRFYVLLAAMAVIGALSATTAFAVQGKMLNARSNLLAARHWLAIAAHNKGGHRVAAIGLIDQAIGQVNAGISVGAR